MNNVKVNVISNGAESVKIHEWTEVSLGTQQGSQIICPSQRDLDAVSIKMHCVQTSLS